MAVTQYKQEQGPLTAGSPGRFGAGRQGLTFLNPISNQVDNYNVTTGDAADWSILVTRDATGETRSLTWTPSGATTSDVAQPFIDAWNADPNNLQFARARLGADATEFELVFADGLAYTTAVTPGGAGAGTLTAGASSSFNQGFGYWAFRTLNANIVTTSDARKLVNPSGSNVLENCAGVTIKALNQENPPTVGVAPSTYGYYPAGRDIPVMRRGYIWVPVIAAVKPGDTVHAIISGANAGKTSNTGGLNVSSIATFTSVAAAGETAEIELTLA